MKKLLLLTAITVLLTLQLSAQNKKEKINTLFKLIKTEKLLLSMVDNMSMALSRTPGSTTNKRKDSLYKIFVKQEMTAYSKRIHEKDMVDLYDKYFTEAEIDKYIAFYKTPEGQKMIDMQPAIQKDLMQGMMVKDMPLMQARFKKKLEELN